MYPLSAVVLLSAGISVVSRCLLVCLPMAFLLARLQVSVARLSVSPVARLPVAGLVLTRGIRRIIPGISEARFPVTNFLTRDSGSIIPGCLRWRNFGSTESSPNKSEQSNLPGPTETPSDSGQGGAGTGDKNGIEDTSGPGDNNGLGLIWTLYKVLKYAKPVVAPVGDMFFSYFRKRWMDIKMCKTIEKGCVEPPEGVYDEVERPILLYEIRDMIKGSRRFGVVIGPSGTGKTVLTRKACATPNTEGMIYFNISWVKSLPFELASLINMKMEHTPFDNAIKNVFPNYKAHHTIPEDFEEALGYVIREIAEAGKRYRQNNKNRVPSLVIDGVDLLAKERPSILIELFYLAKFYANNGDLRIIFVIRAKYAVPLINRKSQPFKRASVVEVLDISDQEGFSFLRRRGVPINVAKMIVQHAGCRFIFMIKAIEICEKYPQLNEQDLEQHIKDEFYQLYVRPGLKEIYLNEKNARSIFAEIMKTGHVFEDEFLRGDLDKVKGMRSSIYDLIEANVLRYDKRGAILWHSKLIENSVVSSLKLKK